MNKRFKRLKCKKCKTLLERRYNNDYLNKHYPVEGNKTIYEQKENMNMHKFAKKLWVCPKCGIRFELSILQYALIVIDDLRGNYIK